MIKVLSFVSKIQKSQKEMKKLFQELMKNLKISFDEKNKIIYEEYYFNGIQIPRNIQFKEVGNNSFKVFWDIDNINIKEINNNQIKFRVEKREEKENEKFIKIYEGNNLNCLINKLNKNTSYEIRICCVFNDLIGRWSKIHKTKTLNVNSDILMRSKKIDEFLNKIYEWSGFKGMELIYRGTRDGSSSKIFHEKCDNQGPTICLYENSSGYIFGGYASVSWTNSGDGHSAKDSFIFTLTNIHGTEPTKFPNIDINNSVYHQPNRGPCFFDDIWIKEDFQKEDTYLNFPRGYKDVLGKGKSIFKTDSNNNGDYVKVKEIEVFKLSK